MTFVIIIDKKCITIQYNSKIANALEIVFVKSVIDNSKVVAHASPYQTIKLQKTWIINKVKFKLTIFS